MLFSCHKKLSEVNKTLQGIERNWRRLWNVVVNRNVKVWFHNSLKCAIFKLPYFHPSACLPLLSNWCLHRGGQWQRAGNSARWKSARLWKVCGFLLDEVESAHCLFVGLSVRAKGCEHEGRAKVAWCNPVGVAMKLPVDCVNTSKIGCAWECFQALEWDSLCYATVKMLPWQEFDLFQLTLSANNFWAQSDC